MSATVHRPRVQSAFSSSARIAIVTSPWASSRICRTIVSAGSVTACDATRNGPPGRVAATVSSAIEADLTRLDGHAGLRGEKHVVRHAGGLRGEEHVVRLLPKHPPLG